MVVEAFFVDTSRFHPLVVSVVVSVPWPDVIGPSGGAREANTRITWNVAPHSAAGCYAIQAIGIELTYWIATT